MAKSMEAHLLAETETSALHLFSNASLNKETPPYLLRKSCLNDLKISMEFQSER